MSLRTCAHRKQHQRHHADPTYSALDKGVDGLANGRRGKLEKGRLDNNVCQPPGKPADEVKKCLVPGRVARPMSNNQHTTVAARCHEPRLIRSKSPLFAHRRIRNCSGQGSAGATYISNGRIDAPLCIGMARYHGRLCLPAPLHTRLIARAPLRPGAANPAQKSQSPHGRQPL